MLVLHRPLSVARGARLKSDGAQHQPRDPASLQAFGLPAWVDLVKQRADALHAVVLQTPYADLESAPNSAEAIKQRVSVARKWGHAVSRVYGFISVGDWKAGGLCDLFYEPKPRSPSRSGDYDLAIDPQSLRSAVPSRFAPKRRVSLTSRDRFSRPTHANRQPWLSNPGDVLGAIPDPYRDSACSMFDNWITPESIYSMDGFMARRSIAFEPKNWGEIASVLWTLQLVVLSKALGLVALVRSRLDAIEHAAMPRLRRHGMRDHNRETWIVALAGVERMVVLTHMESELLKGIATTGTVKALRNTKQTLIKKVPELGVWILNAPRAGELSESEAIYSAPQDLVERIGVTSGKKK